ncbi:unnamed protein product [Closterium sp. Yama58-4]|nr:unnamed protein product [Closterium sp. Yama58-4]
MRAAAAGRAPWGVVKGVFCGLLAKMGTHRVSLRAFNEYLHVCQLALPPAAALLEMLAGLRWMAQAGTIDNDTVDGRAPHILPDAATLNTLTFESTQKAGTVGGDTGDGSAPHILPDAATLPEMLAGLRWMAQAGTIGGDTVDGDSNDGTVDNGAPHILPDAATLNTLMPAMRRADRAAAGLLLYELLVGGKEEGRKEDRDLPVGREEDKRVDGEGDGEEGVGGEREGRKSGGGLTRLTLGDWAEFGRTGRLRVLERQLQGMEERSKAKASTPSQSPKSTKGALKADAHMCSAALSACRRRGLWWEADAVWALMERRGIRPTPACLTTMVSVMARAGKSERAQQVVERAQAAGVAVQQQTANALLDALASTGDVRRTAALFSRLFLPSGNFSLLMDSPKKGLRPSLQADTFSFNALLKAHARRLQTVGAVQTVQSVQSMAQPPNLQPRFGNGVRLGNQTCLEAAAAGPEVVMLSSEAAGPEAGNLGSEAAGSEAIGLGATSEESQEGEVSSMGMGAWKEQQEAGSDSGDAKGKASKDVNGWAVQGPVEVFEAPQKSAQEEGGSSRGMGAWKQQQEAGSGSGDANGKWGSDVNGWAEQGPVEVFKAMQRMGIAIDEYSISLYAPSLEALRDADEASSLLDIITSHGYHSSRFFPLWCSHIVGACVGRGGEGEAGREDVRRGMEVYGRMRGIEREEDGALEKVIWTLLRACEEVGLWQEAKQLLEDYRTLRQTLQANAPRFPTRAKSPLTPVSIIMPIHNAEPFLQEAIDSIRAQSYKGLMELVVFDDGPSTDQSRAILEANRSALAARGIALKIVEEQTDAVAREERTDAAALDKRTDPPAIDSCHDDKESAENCQYTDNKSCGVDGGCGGDGHNGSGDYDGSSGYNGFGDLQLVETTVIALTWFCSRQVFDASGPFDERGPGTPDDLMFFHQHLGNGGWLGKVPQPLVTYRFHSASVTGSRGCPWESIWLQRVNHLEARLLSGPGSSRWSEFTIWNAGKEGRRLYRSLTLSNQAKV